MARENWLDSTGPSVGREREPMGIAARLGLSLGDRLLGIGYVMFAISEPA